jgi:hypothetical protein
MPDPNDTFGALITNNLSVTILGILACVLSVIAIVALIRAVS